jgi:outer membrane protein assembly factor BamB
LESLGIGLSSVLYLTSARGAGSSTPLTHQKGIDAPDKSKDPVPAAEIEWCVSALDLASGTERWTTRSPRARRASRTELVATGTWSERTNVVWKVPVPGNGWSQPVVAGEVARLLFACLGLGAALLRLPRSACERTAVCAAAGASGGLAPKEGEGALAHQAWQNASSAPGMPSPVSAGGQLYALSSGFLSCFDATSGKPLFKERLEGTGVVVASPIAVGEHLVPQGRRGVRPPVARCPGHPEGPGQAPRARVPA